MNEGLVKRDLVYTVSQVTELVKTALEVAFPQVWIEGEVSGYKKAASGHVFFSLKDEKSVIKAVLWQSAAKRIVFDLKDGLKVICRGKVSVYEPRGDYQFYVDLVEPKGKGALQLRFEQLKEKLKAEGLFAGHADDGVPPAGHAGVGDVGRAFGQDPLVGRRDVGVRSDDGRDPAVEIPA